MSAKHKAGPIRLAIIAVGKAKKAQLHAQASLDCEQVLMDETRRTIFKNETEQAYFLGLAELDYQQALERSLGADEALEKAVADAQRVMSQQKRGIKGGTQS